MKNTIKLLSNENAPDYLLTKYIAPTDPVGRWAQYNEAFREINENPFLAELPEELTPFAAEGRVVSKSTYSAMKSDAVLAAAEGKKAIILTGVTAECSVLATMMDAIDMGYEVVYLYDCIARQSAEVDANVRGLAELYAPIHTTVMSSDEYLAAIRRTAPAAF
ncbi:MAG: isochorismatase family protein [Ruminococcaceae bacterium]|nr:isochorismatase family protein [Oscillospiraceae bacterium]